MTSCHKSEIHSKKLITIVGDGVTGIYVADELTRRGVAPGQIIIVGSDYSSKASTKMSGGLIRRNDGEGKYLEAARWSFDNHWVDNEEFIKTSAVKVKRTASGDWESVDLGPAGYVHVDELRCKKLSRLMELGVAYVEKYEVHNVSRDEKRGLHVVTDNSGRTISSDVVVICAGVQSLKIAGVSRSGLELKNRPISYCYFENPEWGGLEQQGVCPELDMWWRPAPTAKNVNRVLIGRGVSKKITNLKDFENKKSSYEEYVREGIRTICGKTTELSSIFLEQVSSFDCYYTSKITSYPYLKLDKGLIVAAGYDGGGLKTSPFTAHAIGNQIERDFND